MGVIEGCSYNRTLIKEKINQANYIRVDIPESGSRTYVNLSTKQLYGDGTGVSENTIYAYKKTFKNKWLGFDYFKKTYLFYPIIADNTKSNEVRKSNYVIVKEVKNISKQKKVIDVWDRHGYKGTRVKVFYNHDCLPIKVQMVDDDTNKWKTIVKYSYFKSTPQKYEKNWKSYVKQVKAGEFLDE